MKKIISLDGLMYQRILLPYDPIGKNEEFFKLAQLESLDPFFLSIISIKLRHIARVMLVMFALA